MNEETKPKRTAPGRPGAGGRSWPQATESGRHLPGGPRGANPPSWSANPAAKMRTNLDIFSSGMEAYRRRDGGRGSVL
jgi:hypothetical protein